MRTIKLELVRHGPPHNQLLSPLTPYLALCANHPPVEVRVPFQHHEFVYRLRQLNYGNVSESAREFEMNNMGRSVCGILRQIPGLIAELNRGDANEPIHLRLILSASELALIPFELTFSSEGLPGGGLPLLLQKEVPICLTREVRRSREGGAAMQWRQPRILFAWAGLDRAEGVPHEEHLAALNAAVAPWRGTPRPTTGGETPADSLAKGKVVSANRPAETDPIIHEIREASLKKIEEACIQEKLRGQGGFTHVHLLAHGILRKTDSGADAEYGLALRPTKPAGRKAKSSNGDAAAEPYDVVVGGRLATALGVALDSADAAPTVTIASCFGGAQGAPYGPEGAAGAGASVAHSLHLYGIPLVLAAQFPLNIKPSVRMVEILYPSLLWGKDPRSAINELRRRLYSEFPKFHDWAAVTAYYSPNREFEIMLPYYELDAIDGAMPEIPEDPAGQIGDCKARLKEIESRLWSLRSSQFDNRSDPQEQSRLAFHRERRAVLCAAVGRVHLRYAMLATADAAELFSRLNAARKEFWYAVTWDRSSPSPLFEYLWCDSLLGDSKMPAQQDPADLLRACRLLCGWNLNYGPFRPNLPALENLIWLAMIDARMKPPEADIWAIKQIDGYLQQVANNWFDTTGVRRRLRVSIAWRKALSGNADLSGDRFYNLMVAVLSKMVPPQSPVPQQQEARQLPAAVEVPDE